MARDLEGHRFLPSEALSSDLLSLSMTISETRIVQVENNGRSRTSGGWDSARTPKDPSHSPYSILERTWRSDIIPVAYSPLVAIYAMKSHRTG